MGKNIEKRDNYERLAFIDNAKAFLIILVVIGHSTFSFSRQIYWFHMPAFFIISGYLYKQPTYFKAFIKRKSIQYLIPYLVWGGIFILINIISLYLLHHSTWKSQSMNQIEDFIFGGNRYSKCNLPL